MNSERTPHCSIPAVPRLGLILPHHSDGYIPQSCMALNSYQKTADKKEKQNKNRELPENKQRIINKIRRKQEKPIDRFSEKVYCEYNNSK